MEYENIIFEPELLGGAEDLCAEKYLLPLQSGRLSLPVRLTPNDLCYLQAAACLRELEDANRAKRPGYELLVKGALLRFLALLIAQGRQCLPTETADTQRLKTVLQWLSAHYAEPLRVADAAGVCSFSASHFMRWFRQMTGQSFISFLNEYRLNTAAEVLQTTDETVLTIASRCGFENLSYFNRAFKAHFGMTPREYREKISRPGLMGKREQPAFRCALHVLKDVNLEVAEGEKLVIIGPSGSGRSTTVRCMNFSGRAHQRPCLHRRAGADGQKQDQACAPVLGQDHPVSNFGHCGAAAAQAAPVVDRAAHGGRKGKPSGLRTL